MFNPKSVRLLTGVELNFAYKFVAKETLSYEEVLEIVEENHQDYARTADSLYFNIIRMHLMIHGCHPSDTPKDEDWVGEQSVSNIIRDFLIAKGHTNVKRKVVEREYYIDNSTKIAHMLFRKLGEAGLDNNTIYSTFGPAEIRNSIIEDVLAYDMSIEDSVEQRTGYQI